MVVVLSYGRGRHEKDLRSSDVAGHVNVRLLPRSEHECAGDDQDLALVNRAHLVRNLTSIRIKDPADYSEDTALTIWRV